MNNITSINSSSNSQYSSNSAVDNNSNVSDSAFLILAEAMSKSVDNASKSLDSQTLEQKEKQAILQELQGINDLEQKKEVIAFLLKTLGSSDPSLKSWLTGLNDQNQDVIDKIWQMLYGYFQSAEGHTVTDGTKDPLTAQIDKDDEKEKKYSCEGFSEFLGDYEWQGNLSKQRLALLDNIKQLIQNPDTAAENLDKLSSDFQDLQNVAQKESSEKLSKPVDWFKKHVTGKLNKTIKEICKGDYYWPADIAMPGAAIFDGLAYIAQGIISIPAAFYNFGQRNIMKDTSTLITRGLTDIQSAESANAIMTGQYVVDANTISKVIQKGDDALNNYKDLLENSIANVSQLITSINYSFKV